MSEICAPVHFYSSRSETCDIIVLLYFDSNAWIINSSTWIGFDSCKCKKYCDILKRLVLSILTGLILTVHLCYVSGDPQEGVNIKRPIQSLSCGSRATLSSSWSGLTSDSA